MRLKRELNKDASNFRVAGAGLSAAKEAPERASVTAGEPVAPVFFDFVRTSLQPRHTAGWHIMIQKLLLKDNSFRQFAMRDLSEPCFIDCLLQKAVGGERMLFLISTDVQVIW